MSKAVVKQEYIVVVSGCGVQFVGRHFGLGPVEDGDRFPTEVEAFLAICHVGDLSKMNPKIQPQDKL